LALDDRDLASRLTLQPSRRLELSRRDIDPDRPRSALREPRGEVRRPAPELDDVESVDVPEHVEVRLRVVPDAPVDLVFRPRDVARASVYSVLPFVQASRLLAASRAAASARSVECLSGCKPSRAFVLSRPRTSSARPPC